MSILDQYEGLEARLVKKYGNRQPAGEPPIFPKSLSQLSDEDLIDNLAIFAEWHAYAGIEVGKVDANRKHHENRYKKKKREKSKDIQAARSGNKDTKKYEIDTEVENVPEVLEEMEKMSYYEAVYKQELSYKEAFERYSFVLSRELTRRKDSQEHKMRAERMGYADDSYNSGDSTPEQELGEAFDFEGLKKP